MATPMLEWKEEYSIGFPALDFEHQTLFRRISELLEDFERQDDPETIAVCLGEIHARMEAHFALEERFMKEKRYRHFDAHKAEHVKFLDDFVDAMAGFENDPQSLGRQTLERDLKHWILDHVMTSDKEMSAMVR